MDVAKLCAHLQGVTCEHNPFQYTICKLDAQHEFTIKVASKAKVETAGLTERMAAEKELRMLRAQPHRMVPLGLLTLDDLKHYYTVFHCTVCTSLSTLIGEDGFTEDEAKFYTASVALGLEQLREDGIIYRNLASDAIVVDQEGYVQLMDMSLAVKADSLPTDFCGYAQNLAPEQVDGQGHGIGVDCWALGILTYEMCCGGANPWLTGDPVKDSEVGVYQRITAHTPGALAFPDAPSADLEAILNDLLHPTPSKRLGCRSAGLKEVRAAKWLAGFGWSALEDGKLAAPHAKHAKEALSAALNQKRKPDGL